LNQLADRFARHRQIQGFDQARVRAIKIGLIGAGAVGNEVLKNLLLLGVGSVDIYDLDIVELSNLPRSVFLRESDLGLPKANQVVMRAQELHPDTHLQAFVGNIFDTLSLTAATRYDLLICTVDNFEARLRVNEIALITNRPWINCAIDHQQLVVETFPTLSGQDNQSRPACFACNLPDSVYERIAKRYSCGGLLRASLIEKTIPTTTITASLVAAIACDQVMSMLQCLKSSSTDTLINQHSQRLFMSLSNYSLSRLQMPSNHQCNSCSPDWGLVARPGRLHSRHPAIALIKRLPSDTPVLFSEGIIRSFVCQHCGDTSQTISHRGQRANQVSDTVSQCVICRNDAVKVEIIESCPISTLPSLFSWLDSETTEAPPMKVGHVSPLGPAWLKVGDDYIDCLTP
jgi:molybdopterin-synthase adenylyltransferase